MRRRSIGVVLSLLLMLTGCGFGSSSTPTPQPAATAGDTAATTTGGAAPPAAATGTVATGTAAPAVPTGSAQPTGTVAARATTTTAPAATTRGTTAPGSATPSPSGSPPPALPSGQTYRDPQGRFSLTVPGNWAQVPPAGATVAFQAPAAADTVPATCNVVLEELPAGVSLDEYDQAAEAELRRQFPDYNPINRTPVPVDGRPGYKRLYTATIAGNLLQLQQVYAIDRNVGYIVSCGASQQSFATFAPTFDQIIGTFRIGTP